MRYSSRPLRFTDRAHIENSLPGQGDADLVSLDLTEVLLAALCVRHVAEWLGKCVVVFLKLQSRPGSACDHCNVMTGVEIVVGETKVRDISARDDFSVVCGRAPIDKGTWRAKLFGAASLFRF